MHDDVTPQESVGGSPRGEPVGHAGTRVEIAERSARVRNGGIGILAGLVAIGASIGLLAGADSTTGALSPVLGVLGVLVMLLAFVLFASVTVISPGETKVVQLFGRYVGTVRRTGLVMTPLLTTRRRVSVRVRNFETSELKVNDADGNPVNIAAIVVWQVTDTARATFAVESFQGFVEVQSEAALRHVATSHPYDNADTGEATLRGSTDQVSDELAHEVAARVVIAGVEVVEARISHLAYAPEIAQAMLQRQQAGAIIAAREKIVEGAVTMVDGALRRLEEESIVELDDERKAAMVSNLLVVLCGEARATPVINAGSLYT
ncbi:SPFH domain-containing protein [Cellulomonas sp. P24]|uniref:SPFH domain-containing protein n=1 Tax=Cellulomonas sp. P24 TaxID=2885206 RepID=UPI00216B22B8|nr:SPFH domain-containing protein [Cellulomonas sp. P24]MCR6494077.1 SPFH domain-containing protein [Cellulomonas sp. P24]